MENNNISDSLVEKIRRLLALSHSSNEHERDLAMKKATELATKYNVNLAAIQIYDEKTKIEPIIRSDFEIGAARKSVTQRHVTSIIQNYFNCKILYWGTRFTGMKLIFIGTESDIELAQYLNGYLNAEMARRWKKYYENTPNVRLEEKSSYMYGLERGLSEKIEESRKKSEIESFESFGVDKDKVKEQYGLMVINHKERLSQSLKEMFPLLGSYRGSSSSRHFSNSFESGRADGRTISLNRSIGQSNRNLVNA